MLTGYSLVRSFDLVIRPWLRSTDRLLDAYIQPRSAPTARRQRPAAWCFRAVAEVPEMKWTNPFYRTAVLTAAGLLAGCAASTNARPEIESARALVTEAD